jgi:hypothetical protein
VQRCDGVTRVEILLAVLAIAMGAVAVAGFTSGWSVPVFYGVTFLALVPGLAIIVSRELRRGR